MGVTVTGFNGNALSSQSERYRVLYLDNEDHLHLIYSKSNPVALSVFHPLFPPQVANRIDRMKATLEQFRRTPSQKARELRKLQAEHSPERFRALILIHDSINAFELDDAFLQRLLKSGLPKILFNNACDGSTYDHPTYTDDHIVRRFVMYWWTQSYLPGHSSQTYFDALFTCLALCIVQSRITPSYGPVMLHLDMIMANIENTWNTIEQHRTSKRGR